MGDTMHSQARGAMDGVSKLVVPFVTCGDLSGFDADASYALDEGVVSAADRLDGGEGAAAAAAAAARGGGSPLPPTMAPINAPYKKAIDLRRGQQ